MRVAGRIEVRQSHLGWGSTLLIYLYLQVRGLLVSFPKVPLPAKTQLNKLSWAAATGF